MPRLTDALVRSVIIPEGRSDIKIYDDRVKGFGVRITAHGSRSFMFNYFANGRERRMTIGQHPAWSVAAARDRAAVLRRMVDAGEDPLEERQAGRNPKTVNELWERYEREVLPRKAATTQRDERSMWSAYIIPALGTRPLGSLRIEDVEGLFRRVSATAPIRANRLLASLRYSLNHAKRWGWMIANPASDIKANAEVHRERFLSRAEVERFFAALNAQPDTPSNLALAFILLTGCRKSEALGATWDQFDLERGVWSKPSSHTKQRRTHHVPLSRTALQVLGRADAFRTGAFVFPSRSGRQIVDLRKPFRQVCQKVGVGGLRIHDLRHSYASVLASGGQSLQVIGRLLGHTQVSTTLRYSHLFDEVLRSATEIVGGAASASVDAGSDHDPASE